MALVAAHEESERIASTVSALHALADEVVVVDDGSSDSTSSAALLAGATVLRASRRRGKGRAIEEALVRLPSAGVWLFADADLADTAALLGPVVDAVRDGRADVAIAGFPKLAGGGFGIVKRCAARAIRIVCGFDAREPLSGQRALTAAALTTVRPLAPGFGLEVGMTIDAVRAGLRVVEIPIEGLAHRPTGRGVRGFAHRARQGVDIVVAVAARAVPKPRRRQRRDARGGLDAEEGVIEPAEGTAWFAWGLGLATLGWLASRRAGPRWRKTNHRGRAIPATLGWAVAVAVAGIALVVVRPGRCRRPPRTPRPASSSVRRSSSSRAWSTTGSEEPSVGSEGTCGRSLRRSADDRRA